MAQLGPSDYRTRQGTMDPGSMANVKERPVGLMDRMSETARDVSDRAGGMTRELVVAIKERPYTTLAIAAGLAFAVGALWKLNRQRPQSCLDGLVAQLPELPTRGSLLPRR